MSICGCCHSRDERSPRVAPMAIFYPLNCRKMTCHKLNICQVNWWNYGAALPPNISVSGRHLQWFPFVWYCWIPPALSVNTEGMNRPSLERPQDLKSHSSKPSQMTIYSSQLLNVKHGNRGQPGLQKLVPGETPKL